MTYLQHERDRGAVGARVLDGGLRLLVNLQKVSPICGEHGHAKLLDKFLLQPAIAAQRDGEVVVRDTKHLCVEIWRKNIRKQRTRR